MTTNDKMEELSRDFIMTIAHNTGYFNCSGRDYGVDLMIRKSRGRRKQSSSGSRYLTSGKAVDIQLKATREKSITYLSDTIKYQFEVKNYNDLVDRLKENEQEGSSLIPLILIIFILPNDESKWVNYIPDGVVSRKEAYWYIVPDDIDYSSNSSGITIEIPQMNRIEGDFFDTLFSTLWK